MFIFPILRLVGQGCGTTETIGIVVENTANVILNVEGLVNDQMGVNQSLCQVRLVFNHNQVENLRMTLVSPAGQEVTLIGPGTVNSAFTPFVDWNVRFGQCSLPAAPDMGLDDQWDNNQTWDAFVDYTGTYYPSLGCLEDFNTGSANGAWQLQIENLGALEGELLFFELIFCDPSGVDCNTCYLFAGEIELQPFPNIISFCKESSFLAEFSMRFTEDPVLDSDQAYAFIVSQNDQILSTEVLPTQFDTLAVGEYLVCGIAYNTIDSSALFDNQLLSEIKSTIASRTVCAEMTDPCLTINIIQPLEETFIDTFFCEGDTLRLRGLEIVNDFDTAIATTFLDVFNNPVCDSLIIINAKKIFVSANLSSPDTEVICNQPVFLSGLSSMSNEGSIESYSWTSSDGVLSVENGPITEASAAGTYSLLVESMGCVDSVSVILTSRDTFELDVLIQDVLCFGDTFQINITPEFDLDDFSVFGPQLVVPDGSNFEATMNGTYFITSQYGSCTRLDSIVLNNEATEIEIEVSSSVMDCFEMESDITVNTNVQNPDLSFDGPGNVLPNMGAWLVNVPGTYHLTITDVNMCSATKSFDVEADQNTPQIITPDISSNCDALPVSISPQIISGNIDSFYWEGPNGFSSPTEEILLETPGIYTITVFDVNACTAESSLVFDVINVPFALSIIGDTLDCIDSVVELCFQTDFIPSEVTWLYNGIFDMTPDCIAVSEVGTYTLSITDQNGCSSTTEFELIDISENIEAIINTATSTFPCDGDSILLSSLNSLITPSTVLSWEDIAGFISNNQEIYIQSPGEYQLILEDTLSNCTSEESVIIERLEDVFVGLSFEVIQPICKDEKGQLNLIGFENLDNISAQINGNAVNFQESYELMPGTHNLEITDKNGCLWETGSILILAGNEEVELDLGVDRVARTGNLIQLDIELNSNLDDISEFNWSDDSILDCSFCLNPTIVASENICLTLNVININGCKSEDSVKIIIDNELKVYIPSIFSPNGDGNNDTLPIYLSDANVKVFDFRIFDRWGNLLIFHDEINHTSNNLIWDGTYNGYNVDPGVFIFTTRLLLPDGTQTFKNGQITLVR